MAERRPVEMVRLEQPEEVFEVESVFGRDAASVFPNMKAQDDPLEALKASIGAKRFVTESELEAIKAARGLSVDDGTASADKPLAEVLAERKQAKQDAFDEQWREMKRGKNRPLEPEELEFLDHLATREAHETATIRAAEAAELAAYRAAVAAAAEAKGGAGAAPGGSVGLDGVAGDDDAPGTAATGSGRGSGGGGDGNGGADGGLIDGADAGAGPGPGSSALAGHSGSGGGAAGLPPGSSKAGAAARGSSSKLVPALRPVLKLKPKGGPGSTGDAKRPRLDAGNGSQQQQQQQQQQSSPPQQQGLAGLLGGYASDDSE